LSGIVPGASGNAGNRNLVPLGRDLKCRRFS
jgi:hypothetical protein